MHSYHRASEDSQFADLFSSTTTKLIITNRRYQFKKRQQMIFTADEILFKGLELAGFSPRRQQRVIRENNVNRFKEFYGSDPVVYAQMWEDLQMTEIPEAHLDIESANIEYFLMTLYLLKCYPTEGRLAGRFKVCEKTARKWSWDYAIKIQSLKEEKVRI
jgi:hypothetical protein